MNSLHSHIDPKDRYHLPLEVLAALDSETEDERTLLTEAWDMAAHYLGDEPDDATFRALGAEIWPNLEAALQQQAQVSTPATPFRLIKAPLRLVKQSRVQWVAMAACIVLLIAVGTLLTQRTISVTAPNRQHVTQELPDGSTVRLNSDSRISFTKNFGEATRQIKLKDGEAFFDVVKAEQPFTIETFNATVTVVGTQFNVRSRTDDIVPSTEVAVESGTVWLAPAHHPDQVVILEAGQSARLDAQSITPLTLNENNTQNALSWRTGDFKYANHPLGTVLNEVERRFDVRLRIASAIQLDEPVGVLLRRTDNPLGPEEILRDICEYNNRCQYRAVPGGFELALPDVD